MVRPLTAQQNRTGTRKPINSTNQRLTGLINDFPELSSGLQLMNREQSMNRVHSLSFRLNTLLLIAALAAATSGCVNKAQQNVERPPAPVTVTAAV